jgi:hypothetical protein
MLNNMNNQILHDKLFNMQENLKAKKGIKAKSKSLQSYAYGGDTPPAGYNAAGFMIDPRFAGEISMGVSKPEPRISHYSEPIGPKPFEVTPMKAFVTPSFELPASTKAKATTKPVVTESSTQLPEDYVENPYENWTPSKIVIKPQTKSNGILDNFLMTPSEVE